SRQVDPGRSSRQAARRGHGAAPAQGVIQTPVISQRGHLANPRVPGALAVVRLELEAPVGVVKLLRTLSGTPPGMEAVKGSTRLAEVPPVAAPVGLRVRSILDDGARHRVPDDLGEVAYPVILLREADVERLVVNRCAGRFEHGQEGPGDVLDVHDGPPGGPVA